jgi:hypothetical protein
MANDTIEKSVPMAGGGGANAALPSNPVPVAPAATKAPATLKPKNTAPAKPKARQVRWILETFKNSHK